MSLKCELKNISTTKAFYDQISQQLKLSAKFGRNLDALHDALTGDVEGPVEIYWHNAIGARNEMGEDDFESIVGTLHEAMAERDDLQVWIGL